MECYAVRKQMRTRIKSLQGTYYMFINNNNNVSDKLAMLN